MTLLLLLLLPILNGLLWPLADRLYEEAPSLDLSLPDDELAPDELLDDDEEEEEAACPT